MKKNLFSILVLSLLSVPAAFSSVVCKDIVREAVAKAKLGGLVEGNPQNLNYLMKRDLKKVPLAALVVSQENQDEFMRILKSKRISEEVTSNSYAVLHQMRKLSENGMRDSRNYVRLPQVISKTFLALGSVSGMADFFDYENDEMLSFDLGEKYLAPSKMIKDFLVPVISQSKNTGKCDIEISMTIYNIQAEAGNIQASAYALVQVISDAIPYSEEVRIPSFSFFTRLGSWD